MCIAGHTELWFSQPSTKGTATGNLIFASRIPFTGNHFWRVSELMSACNIRFFKKVTLILFRGNTSGQSSTMVTLPSRKKFCSHRGHPLVLQATDDVTVQGTMQNM